MEGTKFWHDRSRYYSQMNNPTEAFLKATMGEREGWLQSCGPTAAVNCLASMGYDVEIRCPGDYAPQPEEVLMDFFNDPVNLATLRAVRNLPDNIPGNRVPQYYPIGVRDVFGKTADFFWGPTFDLVSEEVSDGRAVMLCLNSPSHYIAVVAYDRELDSLVYHDSWGTRFKDNLGGFARRLTRDEFKDNVKSYYILFR